MIRIVTPGEFPAEPENRYARKQRLKRPAAKTIRYCLSMDFPAIAVAHSFHLSNQFFKSDYVPGILATGFSIV
jgi:hypothetical protein